MQLTFECNDNICYAKAFLKVEFITCLMVRYYDELPLQMVTKMKPTAPHKFAVHPSSRLVDVTL